MKKSSVSFDRAARHSRAAGAGGFTLIELLVVIAIIALLAALHLPALARTKVNAQGIVCLSNMRQMQLAALLYANNNRDVLPANVPLRLGGDSTSGKPNWVDGQFSSLVGNVAESPTGCATNPFYLGVQGLTGGNPTVTLVGSIGPYARTADDYHCPADKYLDPAYGAPRVRSCMANAWVDGSGSGLGGNNKVFKRISDFGGQMAASNCFVYLDGNPQSLSDGWFRFGAARSPADVPNVFGAPAINHGHYSSLSFADGHAEPHEWHDAFIRYTHSGISTPLPGDPGGTDTQWIAAHGTYALQ
jgi:prepilin-type N-terminal cleavage/methylation domain-containing protein